jgi:hypothetical protein
MEENRFNTMQIRFNIDKEANENKLIEKMNNQFLAKEKKCEINAQFDDAEKNIENFVKQCEEELKGKKLVLERLRGFATEDGHDRFRRLISYKAQNQCSPYDDDSVQDIVKNDEKESEPVRLEDMEFIVTPPCSGRREPSPEKKHEILQNINSFGTENGKKLYNKYINYNSGDSFNEDNCDTPEMDVEQKHVENNKYEYVNHPSHYNNYSVEVIDMMLCIYGPQKTFDFCEMNAYKYRMRMGTKPGIDINQDLEKERWYLKKAKEIKEKYKINGHCA